MSERPRYSREDIEELKGRSRGEIFEIFGSFDERSLDEAAFTDRVEELLDPALLPGIEQIRSEPKGGDVEARLRVAKDVLANRFTFYGETHQLPEDIDWDDNPGTAHWGHDLNRFNYLPALTEAYTHTGRIAGIRGIIVSLVCPMQAVMSWEDVWRALNGRLQVGQGAPHLAAGPGAWIRAQPHPLKPAPRGEGRLRQLRRIGVGDPGEPVRSVALWMAGRRR